MAPVQIAPASGKLGILLVGLGAVSTTLIAGVLAVRQGLAKPVGALSQMGTLRLGKRTEGRSPRIADVLPLATLDDIVFGGWDLFEDNCYEAARTAGVLDGALLEQAMSRNRLTRSELESEMRLAGIAHVADVAWGVLETNGKISFIARNDEDRSRSF